MHTQTELGIVLEQRVRPCRALTLGVGAIGSRGCRSRIYRSTARSVGNHHLVTEELRNGLDIGSLAATCAGARELEQRLRELRVLHSLGSIDNTLLVTYRRGDLLPILSLLHLALKRLHNQSLVLGGADIDTVAATRTIQRRHLYAELVGLGLAQTLLPRQARSCGLLLRCEERTDSGVRADIRTLVALDTVVNDPLGNVHGDTALLVCGRTVVPRAVLTAVKCRNRQIVTLQGVDRIHNLADELRTRHVDTVRRILNLDIGPLGRNLHLLYGIAAGIYRSVVHVDDILALLAVRLQDGVLHLLDSLLERNHIGDLEECRLHDGVGTRSQTQLGCDLRSVDDIEVDIVLGHVDLHVVGQRSARGSRIVYRVQKERTALLQTLQHIILVDIRRNVAGHEIGRRNQIGRADRVVAETQVRRSVASRLLRVVRKVCLTILVGRTADDLDRVLVCADRTVRTQTEEEGLERTGLRQRDLLADRQREIRHIIVDADSEVVLRLGREEVLDNGQNLCRRGILRRKTVAAADDKGLLSLAVEHILDIEVEGLAVCSGLLRTVEYADTLYACGNRIEEILLREGTVEVYGDKTHLAALSSKIVDALLDGLVNRTHRHDHVLGIGSAVVGEGLVSTARDLRDRSHSLGNHVGNGVVELVRSLTRLEIYIGVLGRTARNGVLGIQRTGTESLQCIHVEERRESRIVDHLDLLDLMRGAESVEEVQERNTGLQCHDVGNARQIHHLLNRRGCQHGKTRLARSHNILMVAENRERLCGQRARRYVEHARKQLTRDLVHVGDHQQQALRCGERRGEGTALQRAVYGTCGTGLRLHLDDLHRLAEHVFLTLRGPLVDKLGHRRGGCDGIYGSYLRKLIGYVSRCIISVTSDKFLL